MKNRKTKILMLPPYPGKNYPYSRFWIETEEYQNTKVARFMVGRLGGGTNLSVDHDIIAAAAIAQLWFLDWSERAKRPILDRNEEYLYNKFAKEQEYLWGLIVLDSEELKKFDFKTIGYDYDFCCKEESEKPWYLYVVKCKDGTYYCGISNNVKNRVDKHNSGSGAKYTKTRTPVSLIYQEMVGNRSQTSKAEYAFKQLSRKEKEEYIINHPSETI